MNIKLYKSKYFENFNLYRMDWVSMINIFLIHSQFTKNGFKYKLLFVGWILSNINNIVLIWTSNADKSVS